MGLHDVQTSYESAPYGIDSNPIKDMIAVYSETGVKGDTVIVGYINKNQLAAPGEFRTFATDANGVQKFYTWMKANGTMEIGGSADNAIRYSPLNTELNAFAGDIQAELLKIQTAITSIGGAYVNAPVSIDISAAKINEIKTL